MRPRQRVAVGLCLILVVLGMGVVPAVVLAQTQPDSPSNGLSWNLVLMLLINVAAIAAAWGSIITVLKAVKEDVKDMKTNGSAASQALRERVDGLAKHHAQKFEELEDRVTIVSTRSHRHRNWIHALAMTAGVDLRMEDDLT